VKETPLKGRERRKSKKRSRRKETGSSGFMCVQRSAWCLECSILLKIRLIIDITNMKIDKLIVQLYNISQCLGWGYLLYLTLSNLFMDGHFSMLQYYKVAGYRTSLEVIQSL